MLKRFIKTALLSGIILIFAASASAWDDVGHKLIAYIAWQQLTPAAREKAIKILLNAPEDSDLSVLYPPDSRSAAAKQREFFMLAAYWSDIVRDSKFKNRFEKYHHGNWHYSDTFWTVENGQMKILPNPSGEEGGKAVEKLFDFTKVLRDKDASDAEKAVAIAWILHLGGDIHQPLHTSARITEFEPKGDQGGNLFLLTPKDTPRENQDNLHWFWDSIVKRSVSRQSDACDADYLPPIAERIMKKYPLAEMRNRLMLGEFDKWQQESFRIATAELFPPTLIRFQTPSEKYKKRAFEIAERQIALAGYRLGTMLNQIFGNETVAETDPAKVSSCKIIRSVPYPVTQMIDPKNPPKNRFCLLDVCPPNRGMVARPMIPYKTNDKVTYLEYDVIKVFENAAQAKKYAEENKITDVSF